MFRLYIISDRTLVEDLPEHLAACALEGVGIQIREKDLDESSLETLTRRVLDRVDVPVLVNSSVYVAQTFNIGLHLPASQDVQAVSIPLVGRSAHTLDEVGRAVEENTDFIVFGPVYETPSKAQFGPPRGLSALHDAVAAAGDIPMFAVGGITLDRISEVRATGAHGVAVIRAVMTAADPAAVVQQLLDRL